MPVPVSLTRWFASTYPQVQFAPQWLEECHAYLQANFTLAAPAMLKKVEGQLLLSDLSLSTVQHAGLLPENERQTAVLLENVKGGVLVQVLEVLEIGRPALELLKQHRERQEDKRVFAEQGRPVLRPQQLREEGTADATANENEAVEAQETKGFPRAMLRLRISDGFHEYTAIETKRIPDLSLEDTPLGCKLMLKTVRCLRGVLTLDPSNCIVKGGSIPDLDADRDGLLEALLESRIRGEEEYENNENPPPQQQQPQQQVLRQDQEQRRPQQRAQGQTRASEPVRAPPPRAPPVRTANTRDNVTAGPSNPPAKRTSDAQNQHRAPPINIKRAADASVDLDDEDEFDEDDLELIAEAERQATKARNGSNGASRITREASQPLPLRLPPRAARPPPGALLYESGPPIHLDSDSEEDLESAAVATYGQGERRNRREETGVSKRSRQPQQTEIIEID